MQEATCVLCGQDNEVAAGPDVSGDRRDQVVVTCPRCGWYSFDVLFDITEHVKDRGFIISGVVRARTERGLNSPTELTEESVTEMLQTAPVPQTMPAYVDSLLLYLAARLDRPWHPVTHDMEKDYPLLFMKSAEDMNGFIVFANEKMGYLEHESASEWRFTVKGWERVELLRAALPDSRQAFVAMSFSEDLADVYEKGLKPGVEDSRYFTAVRSDREEYLGRIDDWIIAKIRRSGLVVADFTENRGGVYYEAGFAEGLRIPVIYTCRADHFKAVHFDTNHINYILWNTPEELREKLNNRILSAVLPEVTKGTR